MAIFAMTASWACGGSIYVEIEGIPGESRQEGFEKWIDVLSVGLDGSVLGKSFGTIKISKPVDKSTPLLAMACVTGKPLREVQIVFRDESVIDEFRIKAVLKLRDVLVGEIVQQEDGSGAAMETIGLKYRSILFRYPTEDGNSESKFADLKDGVDTDEDGMPDRFEEYHGFDPQVKDGDKDADDDGLSNYSEFRLGLNPRSSASFFKAGGKLDPADPSKFKISWEGKPGLEYDIYCTTDLSKPFQLIKRVSVDDFDAGWEVVLSGFRGFYQVRPVTE